MEAAKNELTLEEAFARLEEVTRMLEDEDISLEQSFAVYQKGMELLKYCNESIDKVEKKVLVLNGEGENWMNFKEELAQRTAEAEEVLKRYLPKEEGFQKQVLEAMNYSALAGGKRLRPVLMAESFRLCGGQGDIVKPFMAALEMIHNYSLVHDDLPSMDNDEYRRGRKTTWTVYGEGMAVLAGDALLNYAFETAASAFDLVENLPADRKMQGFRAVARALQILSGKAGVYGMIGGQCADICGEELPEEKVTKELLWYIHKNKTAALIEAALVIGAVLAGGIRRRQGKAGKGGGKYRHRLSDSG